MRVTKQEREDAKEMVKKFVKPGDTVYTVIRGVSRSGMSRTMDVYAFYVDEKGKVQKQYLTGWCVKLGLGSQSLQMWRNSAGMRVNGCGMDMGFHVVYSLGRTLWPEGDGKHKTGRNGDKGAETDGGYLLRHEWI